MSSALHNILIVASCIYFFVLIAAIYLTRATIRRDSILAVIGTTRDYLWAAGRPDLIGFGPGTSIVLVDAACWVILAGLAQLVMFRVAGPLQGDRSARTAHGDEFLGEPSRKLNAPGGAVD